MNNYIGTEKIKKGTVLRIEGHIGNIELVNQDSWRVDTRWLAELEQLHPFLVSVWEEYACWPDLG